MRRTLNSKPHEHTRKTCKISPPTALMRLKSTISCLKFWNSTWKWNKSNKTSMLELRWKPRLEGAHQQAWCIGLRGVCVADGPVMLWPALCLHLKFSLNIPLPVGRQPGGESDRVKGKRVSKTEGRMQMQSCEQLIVKRLCCNLLALYLPFVNCNLMHHAWTRLPFLYDRFILIGYNFKIKIKNAYSSKIKNISYSEIRWRTRWLRYVAACAPENHDGFSEHLESPGCSEVKHQIMGFGRVKSAQLLFKSWNRLRIKQLCCPDLNGKCNIRQWCANRIRQI